MGLLLIGAFPLNNRMHIIYKKKRFVNPQFPATSSSPTPASLIPDRIPRMAPSPTDIAIIGMACRYPGAPDLDAFWRMLCEGREGITRFTEAELLAAGVSPATLADPNYVRTYGWLEGIEEFDAAFFGYTPREAQLTDPQHRLFLQACWHALEHAGYDPARCNFPIGVFGGAGQNAYRLHHLASNPALLASAGALQATLGNDKDFLTTRVSYKLGLTGPSLDVQTACSTSLVAAHLAVQSLLTGECDMALAGGASIVTTSKRGYPHVPDGTYSPDGHTRTFDARAQGMVGGDGVGVIVLKRLDDALTAGDTIWAVIKGTAVNNDGAAKIGFTAPAVEGQARVIAEAQAVAGVEPDDIGLVELHGTATPLGDPVEFLALMRAFEGRDPHKERVALGSVKSNIGHTNAAAGVAGLIKTALALHFGLIPPSLHFASPNPEIDLARSPFFVNTALREWTGDASTTGGILPPPSAQHEEPLVAGVSAFGMGGTNAHAILASPPARGGGQGGVEGEILTLSAKTTTALEQLTDNFADHLAHPSTSANPQSAADSLPLRMSDIPDIAYTLHLGRQPLPHRRFTVAASLAESATALRARDPKKVFTAQAPASPPPVAFLFPGQGSQYPSMARGLYDAEPVFREWLDKLTALFSGELEIPLLEVIFGNQESGIGNRDAQISNYQLPITNSQSPITQTQYTQPTLFAVEYALAQLLMSWGIQPAAMLGHSIGEYVAATLAGVFSLEDACQIVAARGRLMAACPPGAMLAISLSGEAVLPYLNGDLSLAAVNEPGSVVVSGSFPAIEQLKLKLETAGVAVRALHTSHAFHSALMDGAREPFRAALTQVGLRPPRTPFISDATGTWITPEQAVSPDYWVSQLRETVRFSEGVAALLGAENIVLLEVGPGTTLTSLARRQGATSFAAMRHPQEMADDRAVLDAALGRLWLAGVAVDWEGYHAGERRGRVPLPLYPFARERHWVEAGRGHKEGKMEGKKPDITDWFYVPSWRRGERVREFDSEGAVSWRAGLDGFYDLLEQVQALDAAGQVKAELIVVTQGGQEVQGEEALDPYAGMAPALCRVISQEYPDIQCNVVDSAPTVSVPVPVPVSVSGPVSAIRGPYRWVRTFDPVQLENAAALRQGGVYLITGGFGGVGRALARRLARDFGARLVLIGRTARQADPRIAELEALGAQVLALAADVGDRAQMEDAVRRAEGQFGALHGVFHCAGATEQAAFRYIAEAGRAECEAHFRPKVLGTENLAHALAEHTPDFVVLVSSISAVLGGLGFAAYAAANAFMDAFAIAQNRSSPFPWISINSDGWEFEGAPEGLVMTPDEGVEAVLRIIGSGLQGQVIISTADLGTRLAQWEYREAPGRESAPAGDQIFPEGFAAPRNETESKIAAIWQALFGIPYIGIHDDFFALGGHSLLATQVLNEVRKTFPRARLTLTSLFENPTVAGLAALAGMAAESPVPLEHLNDDEVESLLRKLLDDPKHD